eukprot:98812-Pelagomonas_calceolata.AAC.2
MAGAVAFPAPNSTLSVRASAVHTLPTSWDLKRCTAWHIGIPNVLSRGSQEVYSLAYWHP